MFRSGCCLLSSSWIGGLWRTCAVSKSHIPRSLSASAVSFFCPRTLFSGRWLNWVVPCGQFSLVFIARVGGLYKRGERLRGAHLWGAECCGEMDRGCRAVIHLTAVLFRISRFVGHGRDVVVSASALRSRSCGFGGCDGTVMLRGVFSRNITVGL